MDADRGSRGNAASGRVRSLVAEMERAAAEVMEAAGAAARQEVYEVRDRADQMMRQRIELIDRAGAAVLEEASAVALRLRDFSAALERARQELHAEVASAGEPRREPAPKDPFQALEAAGPQATRANGPTGAPSSKASVIRLSPDGQSVRIEPLQEPAASDEKGLRLNGRFRAEARRDRDSRLSR